MILRVLEYLWQSKKAVYLEYIAFFIARKGKLKKLILAFTHNTVIN